MQSLFEGKFIKKWSGSSAWLEYLPVTQGVAGSSPVRTAKATLKPLIFRGFFIWCVKSVSKKFKQQATNISIHLLFPSLNLLNFFCYSFTFLTKQHKHSFSRQRFYIEISLSIGIGLPITFKKIFTANHLGGEKVC